jgi:hypothetical protein
MISNIFFRFKILIYLDSIPISKIRGIYLIFYFKVLYYTWLIVGAPGKKQGTQILLSEFQ